MSPLPSPSVSLIGVVSDDPFLMRTFGIAVLSCAGWDGFFRLSELL